MQINPLDTFGGIARSILNQIMSLSGSVIHFVANKGLTLSIKDREHIDQVVVSTIVKQGKNGTN